MGLYRMHNDCIVTVYSIGALSLERDAKHLIETHAIERSR